MSNLAFGKKYQIVFYNQPLCYEINISPLCTFNVYVKSTSNTSKKASPQKNFLESNFEIYFVLLVMAIVITFIARCTF